MLTKSTEIYHLPVKVTFSVLSTRELASLQITRESTFSVVMIKNMKDDMLHFGFLLITDIPCLIVHLGPVTSVVCVILKFNTRWCHN